MDLTQLYYVAARYRDLGRISDAYFVLTTPSDARLAEVHNYGEVNRFMQSLMRGIDVTAVGGNYWPDKTRKECLPDIKHQLEKWPFSVSILEDVTNN